MWFSLYLILLQLFETILTVMEQTTRNSLTIKASPEEVYQAFTSAKAMETWQAPEGMTARVHRFDFIVGGGYEMSLFYPDSEKKTQGKTQGNEDKYSARFTEIVPNEKIVQVIQFETNDPDLMGEMIMEVTLKPVDQGTEVTYHFRNIPKGIKPADNEEGTISTLQKLARYVKG